jgi:hypothetical protein
MYQASKTEPDDLGRTSSELSSGNDDIGDLKTKKNVILPKMFAQQVIELEI